MTVEMFVGFFISSSHLWFCRLIFLSLRSHCSALRQKRSILNTSNLIMMISYYIWISFTDNPFAITCKGRVLLGSTVSTRQPLKRRLSFPNITPNRFRFGLSTSENGFFPRTEHEKTQPTWNGWSPTEHDRTLLPLNETLKQLRNRKY